MLRHGGDIPLASVLPLPQLARCGRGQRQTCQLRIGTRSCAKVATRFCGVEKACLAQIACDQPHISGFMLYHNNSLAIMS